MQDARSTGVKRCTKFPTCCLSSEIRSRVHCIRIPAHAHLARTEFSGAEPDATSAVHLAQACKTRAPGRPDARSLATLSLPPCSQSHTSHAPAPPALTSGANALDSNMAGAVHVETPERPPSQRAPIMIAAVVHEYFAHLRPVKSRWFELIQRQKRTSNLPIRILEQFLP